MTNPLNLIRQLDASRTSRPIRQKLKPRRERRAALKSAKLNAQTQK